MQRTLDNSVRRLKGLEWGHLLRGSHGGRTLAFRSDELLLLWIPQYQNLSPHSPLPPGSLDFSWGHRFTEQHLYFSGSFGHTAKSWPMEYEQKW